MPLPIIDTHLHVWDFKYSQYDWLKSNQTIINRNYFIEELDAERRQIGVISAVLVQADNTFSDTDRMLEIAAQTPWVSGVVGWVPLKDPAATAKKLDEKYLHNKYFKGVRHLINDEPDEDWLLHDRVIESLRLLAKYNIPYDIVGITTRHLEVALEIADEIPELKMMFDHLNQPPVKTKQLGKWGELMKTASRHPNFYAKISGLGTTSGDPDNWTEDDLAPYVEFVLKHFGEDRCCCGGDWPVLLLSGSYTRHWNAYTNILQRMIDPDGQAKVLAGNAKMFYSLDIEKDSDQ